MYKISHACQGVCICIAAKEDSSGSKESDGKVGVLVAVYYGEPAMDRGAQQMMERGGGGERYRAPRGPNPASISSFSLCADRRHHQLEKSHFYTFPVHFNNLLKLFFVA